LVSVFSAFALQGKKLFTPAPNGAIEMKIGEFQKYYNNFFKELSCCNILKTKQLHQQPVFQTQFCAVIVQSSGIHNHAGLWKLWILLHRILASQTGTNCALSDGVSPIAGLRLG